MSDQMTQIKRLTAELSTLSADGICTVLVKALHAQDKSKDFAFRSLLNFTCTLATVMDRDTVLVIVTNMRDRADEIEREFLR
jgi:hypothetical protein